MKSLRTIGIGAGTMGSGIAQVCAHAGMPVSMPDVDEQGVAHRYVEAAAALARRLGKKEVFQHELHDSKYAMENYVIERLRTSFPDVPEGWPPT